MARWNRTSGVDVFSIGTKVRIRRGLRHPCFKNISISGWTGTVVDIDSGADRPMYLVEWSRETAAGFTRDYLQRCEHKLLAIPRVGGLHHRYEWRKSA